MAQSISKGPRPSPPDICQNLSICVPSRKSYAQGWESWICHLWISNFLPLLQRKIFDNVHTHKLIKERSGISNFVFIKILSPTEPVADRGGGLGPHLILRPNCGPPRKKIFPTPSPPLILQTRWTGPSTFKKSWIWIFPITNYGNFLLKRRTLL